MNLPHPKLCDCGNLAVTMKQHEPICQRCHDLERNQLVSIKANRKVGVVESPGRGKMMNWDDRYSLHVDSSPIAGASLLFLEQLLKAA
jgi:hypothetical protein